LVSTATGTYFNFSYYTLGHDTLLPYTIFGAYLQGCFSVKR
jgi:hypothetical protein